MRSGCHTRAMSLVETVVACMILSGTVVTVSAINNRSFQERVRNEKRSKAVTLLQRQLNMMEYMGLDAFLEGPQQGDFGEDYPGFNWSVQSQVDTYDGLYQVDVTVFWAEGSRLRQLKATTRMRMLSSTIGQETDDQIEP